MENFTRFLNDIGANTNAFLLAVAGLIGVTMLVVPARAQESAEGSAEPPSAECQAFAADPDADVGEIIRAGCQPTIAQMSALMDNPLGNVAMLFTQFDFYVKREPVTGREDTQYNYMGIAQFPKKLTKNWNLINRVIWNVGSVPLDLDANSGFGSGPGEGPIFRQRQDSWQERRQVHLGRRVRYRATDRIRGHSRIRQVHRRPLGIGRVHGAEVEIRWPGYAFQGLRRS
jgi:hypothetical protein